MASAVVKLVEFRLACPKCDATLLDTTGLFVFGNEGDFGDPDQHQARCELCGGSFDVPWKTINAMFADGIRPKRSRRRR